MGQARLDRSLHQPWVTSLWYKGLLGCNAGRTRVLVHSGKDVVAGVSAMTANAWQYPSPCVAGHVYDLFWAMARVIT